MMHSIKGRMQKQLYFEVPEENPNFHNQKELYDCTDEEFDALFEPPKLNIFQKIVQFIFFIVFLGPLKIIMIVLGFLGIYIGLNIVVLFSGFFKTPRAFKSWANSVLRPIVRLTIFSMGIVHINFRGRLHRDVRTIVCNHLSLVETVILIYEFPISYLAAAYLKSNRMIQAVARVFEFIFVDRSSKSQHVSEQIKNIQNDPSLLPVLIFPEGKVTNGHACIGFRTGAFVSDTPIQPVALRFRHWLAPKWMSTISWTMDPFPLYCYQLLSTPFLTMDVDVLDPYFPKGDNKSPAERASEIQLRICNFLGIPAYSKTNKEFFAKHKQQ